MATHSAVSDSIPAGMALMVCAMLLLPCLDAVAKVLSATVPSGQIAWARFLFQVLFLAPFVLWRGLYKPNAHLWAHAARGFLLALATLLFFSAIKHMPLANAISIFFLQPFIVTILAAVFLGEAFGWRRMMAIAVGFGGAMLIIKPSYAQFGWTAFLPIGTAFSFACYVILTRWLARSETALTMQFVSGVFGALTMTAGVIVGSAMQLDVMTPVWPTATEWLLLGLLGAIATFGHILVVFAFNRAPVAVLAPFQYLEIISATLLGFIIFNDFPDALTWLGIIIIVGSGLFVFYRERKLSMQDARMARPS